jgi:hypothetical protein
LGKEVSMGKKGKKREKKGKEVSIREKKEKKGGEFPLLPPSVPGRNSVPSTS